MVSIGGSTAQGLSDGFSDMDMAVYWDTVDGEWLQDVSLQPYGGERFTYVTHVESKLYVEQYFIGCAKVDIAHLALDWWETTVADVLERHETEEMKQDLMDGFVTGIPLFGQAAYEEWRARIAAYPAALALKMVTEQAMFYPEWVLEAQALGRGETFAYYDIACGMLRHLFGTLAGLNRVYIATEKIKHVEALVRRLPIAPTDLLGRVNTVLTDPQRGHRVLRELIEETLDLLETHMPEFDTSRKRWIQAMTLEPCMEKPPFVAPDMPIVPM
jgi:hypothetical protein